MRYRLDLVLKPAEGALTRVIGMAERRGFTPQAISGEPAGRQDSQGWVVATKTPQEQQRSCLRPHPRTSRWCSCC